MKIKLHSLILETDFAEVTLKKSKIAMVMNVKLKENWIAAFDEFDIREVNNSFKQPVNIIASFIMT